MLHVLEPRQVPPRWAPLIGPVGGAVALDRSDGDAALAFTLRSVGVLRRPLGTEPWERMHRQQRIDLTCYLTGSRMIIQSERYDRAGDGSGGQRRRGCWELRDRWHDRHRNGWVLACQVQYAWITGILGTDLCSAAPPELRCVVCAGGQHPTEIRFVSTPPAHWRPKRLGPVTVGQPS